MKRFLEFYPTPEWATKTLFQEFPEILLGATFLDPCNGKGAISNLIKSHVVGARVETNDLDTRIQADYHYDVSYRSVWNNFKPCNWIVTNPPFSEAFPILENSCNHATTGVAFLLRISFLEPTQDRQRFLSENPPHKLIVLPRISFAGDGKTDSVTCGWMIWFTREKWRDTSSIKIIRKS